MQTVWSRVAQTRCLCNCPSCVSITGTVTRRTTTATSRRRIRAGDVFTVFASSLAATATLLDSTKKDARRFHWDRVIDEARAQVQATETRQQTRLASLAHASGGKVGEGYDAVSSSTVAENAKNEGERRYSKEGWTNTKVDTWAKVFDWAEKQDANRAAMGFQDWKGVPLSLLQSLSSIQLQQLVANDALLRRFYGGPNCASLVDETSKYNLKAKKLKTLEYSVAKLVLSLLADSSAASSETESDAETSTSHNGTESATSYQHGKKIDFDASAAKPNGLTLNQKEINLQKSVPAKNMLKRVENDDGNLHQKLYDINSKLRDLTRKGIHNDSALSKSVGSLSAPSYNGLHGDEAKFLNNALSKILVQTSCKQDLTPSVTKICYNLLKSKKPPNTHSYNVLLVQFCRLDRPQWVKAVWTSMRESHVRPNELTHSTLLSYYTVTNKAPAFTSYLLLMSGHNGGLAIVKSKQILSPIVHGRYRFFGRRQRKAAEKARMNGEVYEALIVGALRFFGAQTAMQYYREMIADGWKSSVNLLTTILKHCYHRQDWEAGVSVWRRIGERAREGHRSAFKWMLCLSRACGQETVFKQILQEAVDEGVLSRSILAVMDSAKPEDIMALFEDVKPHASRKHNGAEAVVAPTSSALISDLASSSPSQVGERALSSNSISPDQRTTSVRIDSHRFEQQPEVLTASISDTAGAATSESMLPKPTTIINPNLMNGSSKRITKMNPEDAHKINGQENQQSQHLQPDHLRMDDCVFSQALYEKTKREFIRKLESETRPSGTTRLDRGYGSRSISLPDTPPNLPNPATWTDLDERPARSLAR